MPPAGQQRRAHRWEEFTLTAPDAGRILADLRRGLGREAGDVPEMWTHYTTLNREGHRTAYLRAEHAALSLFGLHQQSRRTLMHVEKVELGDAVLNLRQAKGTSEEAVDTRMGMVATSTDTTELIGHLRGLVTLLRGHEQPLDYTRLFSDLCHWDDPVRRPRIRRRWGGQYMNWRKRDGSTPSPTQNNP